MSASIAPNMMIIIRRTSLLVLLALGFTLARPAIAQTPSSTAVATKPAVPRTPDSAITPASRNPNRHAQFLYRAKQGPVGLLFLGDSITDGWARTGEWTWLNFSRYSPANFGVSGERTENVLWRILNGELDGLHPKVTVILIGTNNVGQVPDEKPEWAANGVKRIVAVVREKIPDTKILLLAVFPRGTRDSALRKSVAEINRLIAPLDDGHTIRYLDIGAKFLDANGELPPDIMPDKLHPSPKGYEIWYAAMEPLLEEMMRD